jgi:protein arginine kinase activator
MAKPPQCSKCSKPATIHLTQIVDNKIYKVDLCEDCPHKKVVTDPEGFSLAEFLLNPESLTSLNKELVRCEQCGFTPSDFKKIGRFGCPACYETFKHLLRPVLTNMHRDCTHRGKIPEKAIKRIDLTKRLGELSVSLADAVKLENYEEAAKVRDEINSLRERIEKSTAQP